MSGTTLTGGANNSCETTVHLADRTMVLQIGANQKQDVGAAIGNMNVYALGLENVQVTTNSLANDAIGKIDSAIALVSTQRAKLGALQNRLDHSIASLSTTTENLTAAESSPAKFAVQRRRLRPSARRWPKNCLNAAPIPFCGDCSPPPERSYSCLALSTASAC